jgi:hypothetical protein
MTAGPNTTLERGSAYPRLLALPPALAAVLAAVDQPLLALHGDRQNDARLCRADRYRNYVIGWERQLAPCCASIGALVEPALATGVHRLMRCGIDGEREQARCVSSLHRRLPALPAVGAPQHAKPHAPGVEGLGRAARRCHPHDVARHLVAQRLPGPATIAALEHTATDDEGVQTIWVIWAHGEAVNVSARQVVIDGLPRGAAIRAHLEHVVAGQVDLACVGAAHRQAHCVKVLALDKCCPGSAAVITAHDAIVVAKEHLIGIVGAKDQRVEVGGLECRDGAATLTTTAQGEAHRNDRNKGKDESYD